MSQNKKSIKSFDLLPKKSYAQFSAHFPSIPSNWKGDGVDHWNVHWTANNAQWKGLAMSNYSKVDHPVLGKFNSIDHMWIFIRAKNPDDRMRTLPRRQVLSIRDSLGGVDNVRHSNMKAMLLEVFYMQILRDIKLAEAMIKKTLPFDCYEVSTTVIPQRDRNASWMMPAFEEIATALRENRHPNFSRLLTQEWMKENGVSHSDYQPWMAFVGVSEKFFGGRKIEMDFNGFYDDLREKLAQELQKRADRAQAKKQAELEKIAPAEPTADEVDVDGIDDIDSAVNDTGGVDDVILTQEEIGQWTIESGVIQEGCLSEEMTQEIAALMHLAEPGVVEEVPESL